MSQRGLTKRDYIEDMVECCVHAQQFVAGRTQEEFLTDIMVQFAVYRALEILGEASKQLRDIMPDAPERFPDIPFRELYAMRNRLIHGYASLAPRILFRIAKKNVGPLRTVLEAHLANWSADLI